MIRNLFETDAPRPAEKRAENDAATSDAAAANAAEPRRVEVNEAENLPENVAAAPADQTVQFTDEETLELFAAVEGEPPQSDAPPRLIPTENDFVETNVQTPEESLTPIFDPNDSFAAEPHSEAVIAETELDEPKVNEPEFKPEIIEPAITESAAEPAAETVNFQFSDAGKIGGAAKPDELLLFQPPPERQSFAETARQNGLAYAAAITLFGSVIFMLIIGWFADLLFGSSPWGKVGGIVIGSLIGFVQLFRISSQIFKKED